uniref:Uncharacterized protein n=1 Tax=Cyprinus carpio carpio TaxID=630221 RepID=A0A9J8AHD1_CYPCA
VFLFLGTKSERIRSSLKHFTVRPAGELGANSSKNIFRFADGSFKLIPSKKCCGILLSVQSVYCFTFRHLAGAEVYSCGPYSCWGVNAAGNIAIRRSVTGASCGGSGVFEAIAGALFMVEVDADGNVFGVDTQGNLVQRVGVTISHKHCHLSQWPQACDF